MATISMQEFIDRVNDKTEGTASDPLTRPEVEAVVRATVEELYGPNAFEALEESGVTVTSGADVPVGTEPAEADPSQLDEPASGGE